MEVVKFRKDKIKAPQWYFFIYRACECSFLWQEPQMEEERAKGTKMVRLSCTILEL